MVGHKQLLIDARKARVPLARVSATYERNEREAKRSGAMLLLGLMVPIVVVGLAGVMLLSTVFNRSVDGASSSTTAVNAPVVSSTVAIAAPRNAPQPMPVASPPPMQPSAPVPVVAAAPPSALPVAPSVPMAVGALTEATAMPVPSPVRVPLEIDCIERAAELATRTVVSFSVRTPAISREQLEPLRRIAGVIARCAAARLEIGGHADDGADPSGNAQLSFQRAQAVADILFANGVPAAQVMPVAYGASRPLTLSRKPQEQARNRRVELIVR